MVPGAVGIQMLFWFLQGSEVRVSPLFLINPFGKLSNGTTTLNILLITCKYGISGACRMYAMLYSGQVPSLKQLLSMINCFIKKDLQLNNTE